MRSKHGKGSAAYWADFVTGNYHNRYYAGSIIIRISNYWLMVHSSYMHERNRYNYRIVF